MTSDEWSTAPRPPLLGVEQLQAGRFTEGHGAPNACTPQPWGEGGIALLPIIGPVFAYVGAFSSAVMVAWYCGIAYA